MNTRYVIPLELHCSEKIQVLFAYDPDGVHTLIVSKKNIIPFGKIEKDTLSMFSSRICYVVFDFSKSPLFTDIPDVPTPEFVKTFNEFYFSTVEPHQKPSYQNLVREDLSKKKVLIYNGLNEKETEERVISLFRSLKQSVYGSADFTITTEVDTTQFQIYKKGGQIDDWEYVIIPLLRLIFKESGITGYSYCLTNAIEPYFLDSYRRVPLTLHYDVRPNLLGVSAREQLAAYESTQLFLRKNGLRLAEENFLINDKSEP